jgi:two-component system, NtrC family, sensor kinase
MRKLLFALLQTLGYKVCQEVIVDTNNNDNKYAPLKIRGQKSQFSGHSMSLRSKFLMGTALILIVVCFISAFIIYYREKNLLEESAYSHTELVMASVEASRAYVRDELRPRMIEEFGYDFFMLEAMSTSYVGRAVMDKLKTSLPEYSYRRVSINARNPASEAREMEKGMIGFFKENQSENNWQGLVDMDGEANYMRFKPVYFEESCMSCHGDPADAPQELLNLYGADRGFGHYPGELAGVIAVGIPVQSALSAIKEKATSVFLVVFLGVSFFYLILSFFFNWIVVNNLRGVINLFKEDVDEKKLPEIFDSDSSADEMEALSRAAQNMAAHLKQNSEELKKHAHNLEVKVAERTSALQESKQLLKDKVITRNKELHALNAIAELTTQARGLADIWPEAVRQCLHLIPAMGVGIYLLDEHTGTLKIRYEHKAADLPREVGCLKVAGTGLSIGPSKLQSMEKSMCLALKGNMDSFTNEIIGHCLNVPLYCRDNVFGVMSFVRVDYQEITSEQKELLLSIGRQMGIAIDSLSGLHKLIQSKELLQSVFDGITDLVILLDRNYRIKMVNKAYLNKYQIELEDVLNLHCFEAHSGDKTSCPNCDMEKVIKTGKPSISETKCGTGQVYLVNFYPILNDRGEVESVIRYARDITNQKKVEQKIQQTEKLVSAGKLAAGVAHEINNPLGIILCYTDLLKRQLADFPQGLKDLSIIEKQTLNCKRIVTDLLHFSRGQKSEKIFSSLNRAIEDVIQIFKHQLKKQKISYDLDLDPHLPLVNFNEDSIKQVFVNLIMNSSQAIDGGGKILISSRYIQKEDMARLTFWDSGTGLKPENRNKIFDPFFSTKKTGESTGLGLSVSYGIIQDHGGDISVKSSPGEWTEFMVHLPVSGN